MIKRESWSTALLFQRKKEVTSVFLLIATYNSLPDSLGTLCNVGYKSGILRINVSIIVPKPRKIRENKTEIQEKNCIILIDFKVISVDTILE